MVLKISGIIKRYDGSYELKRFEPIVLTEVKEIISVELTFSSLLGASS